MLELPSIEILSNRIHPPSPGVDYGDHRHDHWTSGCLVFLLPDRTTSYSDPSKSA
jgi:hypothetical protein